MPASVHPDLLIGPEHSSDAGVFRLTDATREQAQSLLHDLRVAAIVTIPVVNISHDSTKPYPYPLFFNAWVSVGVSPDTADCYQDIEAEAGNSSPRDMTIGGLPFKVGTTSDAGMMKYTTVTSYRIIHDGDGFSRGTQSRIGILENCQLCHGSYEMDIVFLAEVSC